MEGERLRISGGMWLMLPAVLLCLPLPWVIAVFLAALVHECGHLLAIYWISGKKASMVISAFSARIPLPEMTCGAEFVCALAGPAAGLFLILLYRWIPRTAICALVQSLFNLLPVYPLDGGRALRCGLEMLIPPVLARKICDAVACVVRVLLAGISIYAAFFWDLGFFSLLVMAVMLFRLK